MCAYMCNAETPESRRNDDDEYCIYIRIREYQSEFISHFSPFNALRAYHNGKDQFMWLNMSRDKEPQDGDVCPICGRTIIIIYETKGYEC